MREWRTLVGLAALCALAFGAVGASRASAEGKTGYTCIEGKGEANTNAHCVPGSSGKFGHVAIPVNEVTQGTLTGTTNQILGVTIFGAEVELQATGVECINCIGENTEVKGVMGIHGTGRVRFTGVTVSKVGEICKVTSDPGGVEGVIETEPLEGANNVPTTGTVTPVTGEVVARFNIITAPGVHAKKCNLVGTHTVTGQATGAASGATAIVNITKASGELRLDGEPAFVEGEATVTVGKEGGEHHAAAATAS